ncbi:MAG TPA: hypothetical protein VFS83_01725 [Ktedonobacterales bacterium]|nr:hypothetical protein [Ktedonobacterales bacterium]
MERPTYAQLRELLRVIAIGQSQEHEGLKISLLALEVYADGCILTILLQRAQAVPAAHERLGRIDVNITDDRGAVYAGHMSDLHGSFEPDADYWEYRIRCTFTPTLDPGARELRIEIPSVQTGALGWANAHRDAQSPGVTTHGPWRFSIQLPAANT